MAIIMISLYSLVLFLFIIFDLLPRLREKQWKVFWVYAFFICSSFILHILVSLGYKIPSPAIPIKSVVSKIFGLQD